jgi:uncharacterized protein
VLLLPTLSIYNELVPGQSRIKTKLKCPICKKSVAKAGEDFPFCSERCRTIDLGKWASGQYVVSTHLQDSDEEEMQNLRDTSDED